MITLIAAMGKNREIGENNALLWDLPVDMNHFRTRTKEKTVVMGRKTFESIGRALPKRRNIVLTQNKDWNHAGVETASTIEKILEMGKDEDIMIIGGSMIYELFMPYATHLSLTFVDAAFPNADSFFPSVPFADFTLLTKETHKADSENVFAIEICEYQRTYS